MTDWIDAMTPADAAAFMASRVEVEDAGTDSHGRRRLRQKNPISMRDLERIKQKADEATAFGPVTIKQSRGPTLHFQGKLLASTEWEARDSQMRLELYETKAGALIPVTHAKFDSGREVVTARVVDPDFGPVQGRIIDDVDEGGNQIRRYIEDRVPNEQAMRFACLDFWDWTDRARSMVRKLGWSLKREIA